MTIARSLLIRDDRPGAYHLISRCVRRAFLCGDDAEHRREWIERGIRTQTRAFAIEVLTFAVMSNHLHIVVHTDPDRVADWSAREVAERWGLLFPRRDPATGEDGPWLPAEVARKAADAEWVATRRERLASVSWFMRILKQRVACKANAEDGVTGHFWEGRFQSVALLDTAAVVSCLAYVDLNPIRARMADTPEDSDHTGIQRRIEARQEHRRAQGAVAVGPNSADRLAAERARLRAAEGEEHGLWIAPCLRATNQSCTVDQYLELVDHTGRMLKDGKRGRIPPHLAPILERLDIDIDHWITAMLAHGSFLGTAVGTVTNLAKEALRRGTRWIVERTAIHRDRRRGRPRTTASA